MEGGSGGLGDVPGKWGGGGPWHGGLSVGVGQCCFYVVMSRARGVSPPLSEGAFSLLVSCIGVGCCDLLSQKKRKEKGSQRDPRITLK